MFGLVQDRCRKQTYYSWTQPKSARSLIREVEIETMLLNTSTDRENTLTIFISSLLFDLPSLADHQLRLPDSSSVVR